MSRTSNVIRRLICIIFHSPAWRSEWVSPEQRYQIRCPRCDKVHCKALDRGLAANYRS